MSRVYRVLALVILSAIPPGASDPVNMSYLTRQRVTKAAARMPGLIHEWSNGMGGAEVTIRFVEETITESHYTTYTHSLGLRYPKPSGSDSISELLGLEGQFDFAFCFTYDQPGVGSQIIINEGEYLLGTAHTHETGGWVTGSNEAAPRVFVHELAHFLCSWTREHGYENWPTCSLDTGSTSANLHCGNDPTYIAFNEGVSADNLVHPSWLSRYLSGTIHDGTGMLQAAWDIETPTEEAERTFPDSHKLSSTPWGSLGPIVIPAVTE
jgi:hypothetical protein